MSDNAKELLREIAPAIRDILWCALVWNDHNFEYRDLLNKATNAAKALGFDRYDGVDPVNAWLQKIDEAIGD